MRFEILTCPYCDKTKPFDHYAVCCGEILNEDSQKKMTWQDRVNECGDPKQNVVYQCKVEHDGTGKVLEEKLKWIDGEFRIAEDDSKLDAWNWSVTEWNEIT